MRTPPVVNIYIDIKYRGNLGNGEGEYSVVLETIKANGDPYTKEYFGGYEDTTINRLALHACINALKFLLLPSDVTFHINNTYVVGTINKELFSQWNSKSGQNPVRQLRTQSYGRCISHLQKSI